MKKLVIVLIIAAIAATAWLYLRPETTPAPVQPEPDNTTLRATTAGDVVGYEHQPGVHAWLGLPYAAPPTGELRWRAPRPPTPWTGVREAVDAGGRCPQKPSMLASANTAGAGFAGTEDCLYLNVWAPADASGLPVMFWIHGGGNTIGSGDTYIGANLAARQEVVVITINYRLGPLGWFAHPALTVGDPVQDSGNYGTLDVIRALEWTRDNAAAFGGDPDNVTVFGESAGAFDTLAMMASPLAEGLFHRAISQSGGFSPTPMREARETVDNGGHPFSAREIVNRLLVADGTVSNRDAAQRIQEDMSTSELRDYLYRQSLDDIFALWDSGGFGMIDVPDNFGDGHVLPNLSTAEIFSNPDNHNVVPVILGTNRDEPALFMAQNPEFVDYFLWVFPRLKDEADYLRRVKYGALAWKARGVDQLADYMTAAGNERVYAYRFDWDEQGSVAGYDLSKALGAAHYLEVPFVFGDFENFPLAEMFDSSPGKEDLAHAMMAYWAGFAYHGTPDRGRDGRQPQWLPWGSNGKTSIIFDTPQDRGIRMMADKVTRESVVARIAADPDIPSQRARCELYLSTFRWGDELNRAEYDNLGDEGCAEFDPDSLLSG